ncbi:response regulator aspartate phosphatase [Bacillus licheniformis]|uniref:response regulator aspartate phosphatase n=1 Tax=Bacillus licheniformis TaxID=1402 RepID=UPI0021BD99A2|nr:hypothetical protein [Bacillus licheniformis]MDE1403220.1 hypothetical protein [Bacillus licheniformis]
MIKKREIEDAIKLKEEIDCLLDDMEENQNLLLYYNLLDARHKMSVDMFKSSGEILEKIRKVPKCRKRMICSNIIFCFSLVNICFSKRST